MKQNGITGVMVLTKQPLFYWKGKQMQLTMQIDNALPLVPFSIELVSSNLFFN